MVRVAPLDLLGSNRPKVSQTSHDTAHKINYRNMLNSKNIALLMIITVLAGCATPQRAVQPGATVAIAVATEAPKAAAPTEVAATPSPTEAPKAAAPTNAAAPTEAPATLAPTDTPKVAAPAASGDVIEINVKMSEFKFELDKTSVPVGKIIRFNIDNAGQREHEMILELTDSISKPLENNGKRAEAIEIASGAKASLEWVFDKPGKYLIGCHIGKHFERGMKILIEVTG